MKNYFKDKYGDDLHLYRNVFLGCIFLAFFAIANIFFLLKVEEKGILLYTVVLIVSALLLAPIWMIVATMNETYKAFIHSKTCRNNFDRLLGEEDHFELIFNHLLKDDDLYSVDYLDFSTEVWVKNKRVIEVDSRGLKVHTTPPIFYQYESDLYRKVSKFLKDKQKEINENKTNELVNFLKELRKG